MRKSSITKPESSFNILPSGFNPFLMQTTSNKNDLSPVGSRPSNLIGWNSLFPPEWAVSRPAWTMQNFPMYFPFFHLPTMLNESRVRNGVKIDCNSTNQERGCFVTQQLDKRVTGVIVNPRDADNLASTGVQRTPRSSYTTTSRLSPCRTSPFKNSLHFERACQQNFELDNQTSTRTISSPSSHNSQEEDTFDSLSRTSPLNKDLSKGTSPASKSIELQTSSEGSYLKFGVRAILSGQLNHNKQQISPLRVNHEAQLRFPNHVTSTSSVANSEFRNPFLNHHYPLLNHPNHRPHCTPRIGPHPNLYSSLTSPILPWLPTSIRGKNRRGMLRRAVFTDTQRKSLEKKFQLQKYIGKPDRKRLAAKLGLKDSQVKIWFQNRRMKWRNSKEREMLQSARPTNNDVTVDDNMTSSVASDARENCDREDIVTKSTEINNDL